MIDYKQQYLSLCKNLNDCATRAMVQKHNQAMKKLALLFRTVKKEEDKAFMLELLEEEREHAKVLIAAHCLGYNVYIVQAEMHLKNLAKSHKPSVAFNAQATLDVWKSQGYLTF